MADKEMAPMPRESPRLAPADEISQKLYNQIWGWQTAEGPAPASGVKGAATPAALSRKMKVGNRDTHPYSWFLDAGNQRNARVIETIMKNDPEASRLLPEVYNTRGDRGYMPIYHFARNEQWDKVEEMLNAGVSIDNIDGNGANLLHSIARAKTPPPPALLALLKERHGDALAPLLSQHNQVSSDNKTGYTPYHYVRSNDLLKWMIDIDKGAGMKVPSRAPFPLPLPSRNNKSPAEVLLDSRTSVAYVMWMHRGETVADEIRGRPVSDQETFKMLLTAFDHKLLEDKPYQSPTEGMTRYIMVVARGEEGLEDRVKLLRALHAKQHKNLHRKEPQKGEFEDWYLKKAYTLSHNPRIDHQMLRRVAETGDVNRIEYADGYVKSNIVYDATLRQREDLPFLLGLKAEPGFNVPKDFKINPDPGLFALPWIDSKDRTPKGIYNDYVERIRTADLLRGAGAKVTRDKGGRTPIMMAMCDYNLPLISYYLHHDLVSDKPNKDEAHKEMVEYLKILDGIHTGYGPRQDRKEIHKMIDAWKEGKLEMIPDHAPKPPPEKKQGPAMDIFSLVRPEEWPTLATSEAIDVPAQPGGQMRLLPVPTKITRS